MKNFFFFLLISILLSISSCKEDPCETTDCGPYGNCILVSDEATCRCDDGFEQDEGGKCSIFSITQYPGAYTATENCTSKLNGNKTMQTYVLDISLFSIREINLVNLGNYACTNGQLAVRALVQENDFILSTGTYCRDAVNQTEYVVSGDGSISMEGISFTYEVSFSQFGSVTVNDVCTVSLSKQ